MAYPFFSLAISLPNCLPVFQLLCILELLHQVINNFMHNALPFCSWAEKKFSLNKWLTLFSPLRFRFPTASLFFNCYASQNCGIKQSAISFIKSRNFFGLHQLIVNVNYFLSCSTKANASLFLACPQKMFSSFSFNKFCELAREKKRSYTFLIYPLAPS